MNVGLLLLSSHISKQMLKISATSLSRRMDMSAQGFSHTFKGPWPVENGLTEIKNAFK